MLTVSKKTAHYCKIILLLTVLSPLFQACSVFNPNRMLNSDKKYAGGNFLDTIANDFIIAQGDVLNILVFPKDGYNLIESQIVIANNTILPEVRIASLDYVIDQNGEANLPIIGIIQLNKLTTREAENKLQEAFKPYYNEPYINIKVINKYATIYRGSGIAERILLDRPNITLLEAIGMAGGIPETGNASKVKVIRTVNGIVSTEIVDLSAISNIEKAQSYIQPNDIIYIEPVINGTIFRELAPIVTTVSSIVVIYAFFSNLTK